MVDFSQPSLECQMIGRTLWITSAIVSNAVAPYTVALRHFQKRSIGFYSGAYGSKCSRAPQACCFTNRLTARLLCSLAWSRISISKTLGKR